MTGCGDSCGFGDTEVTPYERLVYEANLLAIRAGLSPMICWDDRPEDDPDTNDYSHVVSPKPFDETMLQQAYATFDAIWREQYPLKTLSDLIVCAVNSDP